MLFFSIALLCLVGTIFPQEGTVMPFGHGWVSGILSLLSPYDIFHSIWFMTLGFLLCVNLVLCMRRRIYLRRRSLLMLLLHGSILVIIGGFALGAFGLDGFMDIPEGTAVSGVVLKGGAFKDLGFSVRCDRFTVDYHENGMPKEFVSGLTFMKNGQAVGQAQVSVNHPARFSCFGFYQESYRQVLSATLTVSEDETKMTVKASEGDIIPLSRAGTQARVVKVWDDLMEAGPAVKLLIEDSSGVRYLWVFKNIDLIRSQASDLFERAPELNPSAVRPYTFSVEETAASYITGIRVKRDPGTPVAAFGGAVFLVSLMLVSFTPRTRKGTGPDSSRGDAAETGIHPGQDQEGPAEDLAKAGRGREGED